MMVSNEHPEVLERLVPDPDLTPKVKAGIKMLSERVWVWYGKYKSLI